MDSFHAHLLRKRDEIGIEIKKREKRLYNKYIESCSMPKTNRKKKH